MRKNLMAVLFVLASIGAHAQVPPSNVDKNIDGKISGVIGKSGPLPMPVAFISGTATLADVANWGIDVLDPLDPNGMADYKLYQYSADCAPAFNPGLVVVQLPSSNHVGAIFFNESGKGYKYIGLTDSASLAGYNYKFVRGYCQNTSSKARFYMLSRSLGGADEVEMSLVKISADGMRVGSPLSVRSPKDATLLIRINHFFNASAPLPSEEALLHSLDRDPPVVTPPSKNK